MEEIYIWVLVPTLVLLIIALIMLLIIRGQILSTINPLNGSDEVQQLINRGTQVSTCRALAMAHNHARGIIDRVFYPSCFAALILGLIMTIICGVVNGLTDYEVSLSTSNTKVFALFSSMCVIIGCISAYSVAIMYNTMTPLTAVDCVLHAAKQSDTNNTSSGFRAACNRMIIINTLMTVVTICVYIIAAFIPTVIALFYFDLDNASSTIMLRQLVAAVAVGSHSVSFTIGVVSGSFAEGMAISLFQLEAETQHRVDGTLRIAANTLISSSGLPIALGSILLDLHLLSASSPSSFIPNRLMSYYLIPATAAVLLCLVFLLLPVLLFAADGRVLIRKARLALLITTFGGAGLCTGTYAGGIDMDDHHVFCCFFVGAIVMGVIVIATETFSSLLCRVAGEHCDISSEATMNSISSFADFFVCVAIAVIVGAANSLSATHYDGFISIHFLVGFVVPALLCGLIYGNCRSCVSTSLSFSKTVGMSADVQDILEGMLIRAEVLDSFANTVLCYASPVVVYCLSVAMASNEKNHTAIILLLGCGLAVLTKGLTMFYYSRATWHIHYTVSAIVSNSDSQRISVLDNDNVESILKGDFVVAFVAITSVLAFLAVEMVIVKMTGNIFLIFSAAIFIIGTNAACSTAKSSLGAAVKNYVAQGGLAYAARFSYQHTAAVMTAAGSTTNVTGSTIMSLGLWRLLIASAVILVPAFHAFGSIVL